MATAQAATAIETVYSQPWPSRKMKKPLWRCAAHVATTITPIIPAAANGVSSPRANSTPAPISVDAARRAWTLRPAHAERPEPPSRAGEAAAAEHLVVAVGGEEQAEHDPQHEQRQIDRVHAGTLPTTIADAGPPEPAGAQPVARSAWRPVESSVVGSAGTLQAVRPRPRGLRHDRRPGAPAPPPVRHRRLRRRRVRPVHGRLERRRSAGSSTTSSSPASTRARSPPAPCSAGVGLIIGIGLLRALGVVVRRTWAGKTQWRVAGTLGKGVVDRLVRQPVSWHQRRPDGDLVARAGVDTDAAISVLAPVPFATGTVLLIVVSAVWLLTIDLVMGAVAVAVFPVLIGLNIVYQKRVDAFYDAAQGHLGDLSAGVHESFDGVQLVKAYGAEQRETERLADDRRPPAHVPGSERCACAARSRRCSTCSRR